MASYSQVQAIPLDNGKRCLRIFNITFTGSETYSSGVAIAKASLACPNAIESFNVMEASSGNELLWKYDFANSKLRVYDEGVAVFAEVSAVPAVTIKVAVIGW